MPGTITQSAIEDVHGGPPPPILPDLPFGGGDNDNANPDRGSSRSASIIGIVVLMCASTMTFGALVSAISCAAA